MAILSAIGKGKSTRHAFRSGYGLSSILGSETALNSWSKVAYMAPDAEVANMPCWTSGRRIRLETTLPEVVLIMYVCLPVLLGVAA